MTAIRISVVLESEKRTSNDKVYFIIHRDRRDPSPMAVFFVAYAKSDDRILRESATYYNAAECERVALRIIDEIAVKLETPRKPARRHYVGIESNGDLYGFSSVNEPRREDTPSFVAVIGPFKTRRAQLWAVKYGKNNPHFGHVNDAERLSKENA